MLPIGYIRMTNEVSLIEQDIDEQIYAYFSYEEIENNLCHKFDLSIEEARNRMLPRFVMALKQSIKIYRILLIIFGMLTLALVAIYIYGEQRLGRFNNQDFITVDYSATRLKMMGEQARWPGFITIICCLRILWIWIKIWRIKRGIAVRNMVVKDIHIHKYQKLG